LKPKQFTIQVREKDVPLAPGVVVTAEIKTGERRVIDFFISSFIKHVDESLTLQ
jgi:hemolysin D